MHFRGQIPPIFDKLDHISACKFLSTLPEHYYYYYYYDDGAAAPHRGSRKRPSRSCHVHRLSITLSRWLQYWSPCTNHSFTRAVTRTRLQIRFKYQYFEIRFYCLEQDSEICRSEKTLLKTMIMIN